MITALDRARALLDTPPPPPVPGQLAAPAPGLRIGSVCSGYRGLDMGVEAVFGGTTAWVSDIDPGANQILAHHWPEVPNLGDLKTVDWAAVEPVDIFCGGYPCQPFSAAGKRKGTDDERHIWPWIARALGVLRPRIAIFENVAGHLRLGFDTVLADLARLGFDVEWCTVRASEVGAPHQRNRLFILARNADTEGPGLEGAWVPGRPAVHGRPAADATNLGQDRAGHPRGRRPGPADHRDAAADAVGGGRQGHRELPAGRNPVRQRLRDDADGRQPAPAADPASLGHGHPGAKGQRGVPAAAQRSGAASVPDTARVGRGEGRPEPARLEGRLGLASGSAPDWGKFAPAIHRWEHTTGRRAPWATDDRNRLNPAFVEWLMGLPAGHVTQVPGLTRNQMLHALGNGVVPQQATAALRLLAARAGLPTAA
ncbi:DNA cytosine methyltransferase [Streptomyces parvus]|uniref:DNA cytosine methyltransferase n=1 Tax=Streptomyces parvus TaxID=66428 RepID=UPI0033EBEBD8